MGTQYCVCRGFQFPTYNPNTEGSLWPLFFPTVNTEGCEMEETHVLQGGVGTQGWQDTGAQASRGSVAVICTGLNPSPDTPANWEGTGQARGLILFPWAV